jgi:hypothetical protein
MYASSTVVLHMVLQAIVRLAVLAILLISAAAVTKLMAINISSTRNIVWSSDVMQQKIATAMQVRLLLAGGMQGEEHSACKCGWESDSG